MSPDGWDIPALFTTAQRPKRHMHIHNKNIQKAHSRIYWMNDNVFVKSKWILYVRYCAANEIVLIKFIISDKNKTSAMHSDHSNETV